MKMSLFLAKKNRSWFWWGINIGVAIAIFVWWWYENQDKIRQESPLQPESLVLPPDEPAKIPVKKAPHPPKAAKKLRVDDLKKIEGLGPRSEQVLKQAKITSFAQLSKMMPEKIKEVLKSAGVRIGSTETWPEQAALAADGKWDQLKALQDSLRGGRRVA